MKTKQQNLIPTCRYKQSPTTIYRRLSDEARFKIGIGVFPFQLMAYATNRFVREQLINLSKAEFNN